MTYPLPARTYDSNVFEFSEAARTLYEKKRSQPVKNPHGFCRQVGKVFASSESQIQKFINGSDTLQNHLNALLEVRIIPTTDSRVALRGQHGVYARQLIPTNTILGLYTGTFLTQLEYEEKVRTESNIQIYAFETGLRANAPIIDGRRSNLLSAINAPHTYDDDENDNDNANVQAFYYRYHNWRYVVFYALKDIKAGEELLFDYGKQYWNALRSQQTHSGSQAAGAAWTPAGAAPMVTDDGSVPEIEIAHKFAADETLEEEAIEALLHLSGTASDAELDSPINTRLSWEYLLNRSSRQLRNVLDKNPRLLNEIDTHLNAVNSQEKRKFIKLVLRSHCADAARSTIPYLSSYLGPMVPGQPLSPEQCTAIKHILSSNCADAARSTIPYLPSYLGPMVPGQPLSPEQRTAIKHILSSNCADAVRSILGCLSPYLGPMVPGQPLSPEQRTAIKDILSSRCPDAARNTIPYLSSYLGPMVPGQPLSPEQCTAIKHILSSNCADAVRSILGCLSPYLGPMVPGQPLSPEQRTAIKDILSSQNPDAVRSILGCLSPYLGPMVPGQPLSPEQRTAIKDILNSHCPDAVRSILGCLSPYLGPMVPGQPLSPEQRTAIKDILSSHCADAARSTIPYLPSYVGPMVPGQPLSPDHRTAIKDILHSHCPDAVRSTIPYLPSYLGPMVPGQPLSPEQRTAIKHILSSNCPDAVRSTIPYLPSYLGPMVPGQPLNPEQRTAIKHILSSQNADTVRSTIPYLSSYLTPMVPGQPLNPEQRTAIKDILGSNCPDAFALLANPTDQHPAYLIPLLAQATDNEKTQLIEMFFKAKSNPILQVLFNNPCLGGRTPVQWLWSKKPSAEDRAALLTQVFTKRMLNAMRLFWTHFFQFNAANTVALPFFNYLFLSAAVAHRQTPSLSLSTHFPFVWQVINSQKMGLVDLLFHVQTHEHNWLSLVPTMQEGGLLWDCFHRSLLVKLLASQRHDFMDTITVIAKQNGSQNYADTLKWAVFCQLWGIPPEQRDAFYQQEFTLERGTKCFYPPAPRVARGPEGTMYNNRPPTPPPNQAALTYIQALPGYESVGTMSISRRITRERNPTPITPPTPDATSSSDNVMCLQCKVAFYQGQLFLVQHLPLSAATGQLCPLCNSTPLTPWNNSIIPLPVITPAPSCKRKDNLKPPIAKAPHRAKQPPIPPLYSALGAASIRIIMEEELPFQGDIFENPFETTCRLCGKQYLEQPNAGAYDTVCDVCLVQIG